jgi:hypothetical protein
MLVHRNPDPMIANRDKGPATALILAHLHQYLASIWTVFDCVADQVREYLLDAPDVHLGNDTGHRCCNDYLMSLRGNLQPFCDTPDECDEISPIAVQLEPPSVQTHNIGDMVS